VFIVAAFAYPIAFLFVQALAPKLGRVRLEGFPEPVEAV
jgi:hypothetical protein